MHSSARLSRDGVGGHPETSRACARVELVEGESSTEWWFFDEDVMMARLDVGGGPRCAWQVKAPGVLLHHFELYWNGSQLFIGDPSGGGRVDIDGTALSGWQSLGDGQCVRFGAASMIVWTSEAARAGSSGVRPTAERGPMDAGDGLRTEATRVVSSPVMVLAEAAPRPRVPRERTVVTDLPILYEGVVTPRDVPLPAPAVMHEPRGFETAFAAAAAAAHVDIDAPTTMLRLPEEARRPVREETALTAMPGSGQAPPPRLGAGAVESAPMPRSSVPGAPSWVRGREPEDMPTLALERPAVRVAMRGGAVPGAPSFIPPSSTKKIDHAAEAAQVGTSPGTAAFAMSAMSAQPEAQVLERFGSPEGEPVAHAHFESAGQHAASQARSAPPSQPSFAPSQPSFAPPAQPRFAPPSAPPPQLGTGHAPSMTAPAAPPASLGAPLPKQSSEPKAAPLPKQSSEPKAAPLPKQSSEPKAAPVSDVTLPVQAPVPKPAMPTTGLFAVKPGIFTPVPPPSNAADFVKKTEPQGGFTPVAGAPPGLAPATPATNAPRDRQSKIPGTPTWVGQKTTVGAQPSPTAPKPQAGPGATKSAAPQAAPADAKKKDDRKDARKKDVMVTSKDALPGFSGDLNLEAPASAMKREKKMRPVTWVLFGITVVLGLVVAFVPLGERGRGTAPAAAQQPPAPTEPEATPGAEQPPADPVDDMFASEEVAPGVASDTLAGPQDPALLAAVTATADQGQAGSSRRGRGRRGEAEPAVVQRPLERQAVDLLVAGHYGQALAHYEWLAAAHPDDRVYPLIVRILERRIRDRCLEHDMQGEECDMVMQ